MANEMTKEKAVEDLNEISEILKQIHTSMEAQAEALQEMEERLDTIHDWVQDLPDEEEDEGGISG